ncbi:hypothetical protein [Xylanimonas sp. McL0601]|uniref:hypothetical protein n=1 Tax=Xylanimonas sp. McL0601 TaxID=3414739 RepID=UPI003CF437CA
MSDLPVPERYARMVNSEFGALLVLKVERSHGKVGNDARRHWLAFCECSCGHRAWVITKYVLNGQTSRCFRCHSIFREKYATEPQHERYNLVEGEWTVVE